MKINKNGIGNFCLFLLFFFDESRCGTWKKYVHENGEFAELYLGFKNKATLHVRKVGQNSAYVFYLIPGEKEITTIPIVDNFKQMKALVKN